MSRLTTEQHRMLEQLTGRQLTRQGVVRKQPRYYEVTKRMGLDLYSENGSKLRGISTSGSTKLKEMLARLKEPV